MMTFLTDYNVQVESHSQILKGRFSSPRHGRGSEFHISIIQIVMRPI